MEAHSLYLHIPFCSHRCYYCDFNTYAGLESLMGDYVAALCREMELLAESSDEQLLIHTIYLGGGTPSLLELGMVEQILKSVSTIFVINTNPEMTMEVNPGTVDLDYLRGIQRLGVNRLSIGVQSFDEMELKMLGRQHSSKQNVCVVEEARKAEFENISLDLIFGLPGQSISSWQKSLTRAVAIGPEHLSLYALTIEPGTPLASQMADGFLSLPDPDIGADMYEWTMENLEKQGYIQYEISNWAKKNSVGKVLESQHNKQYWLNQPYLGFGAGAHGFIGGYRIENVLSPSTYIDLFQNGALRDYPQTPATMNCQKIDHVTEMQETMMMGLRLVEEGVSRLRFQKRFNKELEEVFSSEIDELIDLGLLEWGGLDKSVLRLTRRGRVLGNQVFMRFV